MKKFDPKNKVLEDVVLKVSNLRTSAAVTNCVLYAILETLLNIRDLLNKK